MNLQLVPKYKKYNKTLNQVFVVSVPPSFRESPESHELPVPIKIDRYKKRNAKGNVRISNTVRVERPDEKPKNLLYRKFNRKESYDDSEKVCGFSRWCAKKKALRDLQKEHKQQLKRVEEWRNWKYQEAERVERAQREKERLKREADYIKQLQMIKQQKQNLVKNTLKTRYPFPAPQRQLPKECIFKEDLTKEPYYPKPIKYEELDDYEPATTTPARKSWRQSFTKSKNYKKTTVEKPPKIKKENVKKNNRYKAFNDPYQQEVIPHKCKCAKLKTYFNKFKEKGKKKRKEEIHLDNDYRTYYDNPKKIKKYEELIVTTTTRYDEPTKSKRQDDDNAELYATYDNIYGTKTKKGKNKHKEMSKKKQKELYDASYGKEKKTKKGKFKDIDKRPLCRRSLSEKFVTCFYRTCCECYCWFSIFLMIGFALIIIV